MVRRALLLFLLAPLFFPYLVLVTYFKNFELPQDLFSLSLNTFCQAFLSTAFTLIFGFLGSFSLVQKRSWTLIWFILLPSFLPSLFFVLAVLQMIKQFPFGLWGIVMVHTLSGIGLAAVVFATLFREKALLIGELCYIEGASSLQFVFKIIQNFKIEIFLIFVFFFVQYWTSLSIPLLVGQQFQTIETAISKQIFTTGKIESAMALAFGESLVAILLLLIYKVPIHKRVQALTTDRFLRGKIFLGILLIPGVIYFAGNFFALVLVFKNKKVIFDFEILKKTLMSLQISLFVGLFIFIFSVIMLLNFQNKTLSKFIFGYIPLSTILIGLGYMLLKINYGLSPAFLTVLALAGYFFPMLYRYQLKEKLDAIDGQIEAAELMGASSWMIFSKIIFPQLSNTIFFLCGLGAFWTLGEFAITRVIFGQEQTLAIFIQNLAGQYRIDLAIFYEMILLLCGILIFYFFNGLRYVLYQKS